MDLKIDASSLKQSLEIYCTILLNLNGEGVSISWIFVVYNLILFRSKNHAEKFP